MSCKKMAKKGKWLTSMTTAFRSPIKDDDDEEFESKDLDLFSGICPLAVVKLVTSSRVKVW